MNITSADIIAESANVKREIRNNSLAVRQLRSRLAENLVIQTKALQTMTSVCYVGDLPKFDENIDEKKMKALLSNNFFDFNVMRAAACSVYSVFYGISESTGNIAHLVHLKDTISNLHKFGAESVSGNALTGEIKGAEDMYVMKTPRDKDAVVDLSHEAFIGLFVTNILRKWVPNFAFVFGFFKCSPPIIDDETKKVLTFCDGESPRVPYIIYEKIVPSETFGEYATHCTVDQFLSIYCQDLEATDIASKLVGFTHYDKHYGNVLVRKINVKGIVGKFCIPYTNFDTKKVTYVVSEAVATAIDYGQSTGTYKGHDIGFGQVGLREAGVTDGAWPLHDAYKLLMFTGWYLLQQQRVNRPVVATIEKIFRFFNKTEPFLEVIEKQRRHYFGMPLLEANANYTIQMLLTHIRTVCDTSRVIETVPTYPILECTSCYTFTGAYKEAYIIKQKPKTFFDFYDVASHLGSSSAKDYDELVHKFDYTSAKTNFMKRVDDHMKDLNVLLKVPFKKLDHGTNIANIKLMRELMASTKNLFFIISKFEDLDMWLKVGSSVAILFADTGLIAYIKNTRSKLVILEPLIEQLINDANDNYVIIKRAITGPQWKGPQRISYPWYEDSAGDVVALKHRFNKDERELFTEQRLPSTLRKLAAHGIPTPVPAQAQASTPVEVASVPVAIMPVKTVHFDGKLPSILKRNQSTDDMIISNTHIPVTGSTIGNKPTTADKMSIDTSELNSESNNNIVEYQKESKKNVADEQNTMIETLPKTTNERRQSREANTILPVSSSSLYPQKRSVTLVRSNDGRIRNIRVEEL
jgi:hypothetical protein